MHTASLGIDTHILTIYFLSSESHRERRNLDTLQVVVRDLL